MGGLEARCDVDLLRFWIGDDLVKDRRPNQHPHASTDATICLTSALAHHDLTDAIPAALDVAIPRGSRTPASTGAIAWHQFDRPTFEIGREQITIPGSDQTIGIYSPERSIADAFRLRGEVGYELARDALREWQRRGGKPSG